MYIVPYLSTMAKQKDVKVIESNLRSKQLEVRTLIKNYEDNKSLIDNLYEEIYHLTIEIHTIKCNLKK